MTKSKLFLTTQSLASALVKVAILLYIGWTVGSSIYRNYKTNQVIDSLKRDIAQLKLDIANEQDMLVYYQTDSFHELEARRRLGAMAPGEKIVILPKKNVSTQENNNNQLDNKDSSSDNNNISNPVAWWQFIFNQQ
jgi:cell division protein FtsB